MSDQAEVNISIMIEAMDVVYICILQRANRFCYAFRQDAEIT